MRQFGFPWLWLALAALFAWSCASTRDGGRAPVPQPDRTAAASASAPLIPRDLLFGNPDIVAVKLSPDGRYLSWVAPKDGVLNLWIAPADDPSAARAVTADKGRGVRIYHWAEDDRRLLYIQDEDGDENWRLYAVDVESGATQGYTPTDKVQARIVAVSPERPGEIVVGLNDRDARFHDLHLLNLASGERTLLMRNDRFGEFHIDDRYRVRLASLPRPDGGVEIHKPDGAGEWKPFVVLEPEDALSSGVFGFTKAGDKAYMISSRGRKAGALVTLDLETGTEAVLAEDPQSDIDDLILHPTTYEPLAYAVNRERVQWRPLDAALAADLDAIGKANRGDWSLSNMTRDAKRWIVYYLLDDGPVKYYLYDRDGRSARFLFDHVAALGRQTLARMYPVAIASRDGLPLVGYYSLPPWRDKGGKPDAPLPLVLSVHGGPWGRDTWGYNSVHQWLANRGYAVLSVNFRGSTGFGKDFLNAGDREWGGKMHDDLLDAVDWALREGVAAKDQVAIFGGSYGGYATLVGITMTPDVFACGVDIVGPSNLVSFFQGIPPYWATFAEIMAKRVGDWRTEEGKAFLMSRSPITYAGRIKKPLLIGHGANDPRVVKTESDQIVETMRKKGIPVTYILYPDEGHGFARPENRMSFFAVSEVFLAGCLGGRSEPFGDVFAGSSARALEGASHIPGLDEAIKAEAAASPKVGDAGPQGP
ncbi:MAG: S9 family peptidase [Myxococcales bacterium]|nr:MAG: S9 family peptidase [Myxococcales bacterium]